MQQNMEYIYTVWQEGSFSRAAQKLYLSQPALSIAVRKVEEELGMPLFNRGQSLSLTPAGALYIQAAKRILAEEAALKDSLNDLSALQVGHLRIGGAALFLTYLLPPVLVRFTKKYPGVQVELNEYFAKEQFRHLEDGDVDLILHSNPMDPAQFVQQLLMREHVLLAVPGNLPVNRGLEACRLTRQDVLLERHLQPDRPRVDMRAFRDQAFLMLAPGNNDLLDRTLQICADSGFAPNARLTLNQQVGAYRLAARGMGLTFATDTLIYSDSSQGLVYYLPDSPLVERTIFLTHRKDRYLCQAAQEFCAMAQSFFSKPNWNRALMPNPPEREPVNPAR